MSNAPNRILIVFAHPALEKSRVQASLLGRARTIEGVTVSDLYEKYPDFEVAVRKEQLLLAEHDIIIWQHPIFWYSSPALLKQWLDMVLEHGWAYGKGGTALKGKKVISCISSGGGHAAYNTGGHNRYTYAEFLRPFEQTARLCGMQYLPPYAIGGTHRMSLADLEPYAQQYADLLLRLRDNRLSDAAIESATLLNELVPLPQSQ